MTLCSSNVSSNSNMRADLSFVHVCTIINFSSLQCAGFNFQLHTIWGWSCFTAILCTTTHDIAMCSSKDDLFVSIFQFLATVYLIKERKNIYKMNKKVGMLLQKSTDTRGVGISSMRKSIYLLKTTPSSHTHRFHPLPLATPTSCSPHPLATPIHSTHSPQLSSIL